jgi:hypothetical protein
MAFYSDMDASLVPLLDIRDCQPIAFFPLNLRAIMELDGMSFTFLAWSHTNVSSGNSTENPE